MDKEFLINRIKFLECLLDITSESLTKVLKTNQLLIDELKRFKK
jgi:GTPase involved in cell partitioning and DNA repair